MFAIQAKRMAALAAVVAVAGGGSTAVAVGAHPVHHHRGIPQHNGGDHDGDNNGGPSDGDGRT